jgi:hypothetical protein
VQEVALKDVGTWAKGMREKAAGEDVWVELVTQNKENKARYEPVERAEEKLREIEAQMGRKREEVAHWEDEGRWTVLLCFPRAGVPEKNGRDSGGLEGGGP